MVKVRVLYGSKSKELTFSKAVVTVGSGRETLVDIPFPNLPLSDEHVHIVQEAEGFSVINLTQDPAVLLNGEPFDSKFLQRGDLLQIIDAEIAFLDLQRKPESRDDDIEMSESEFSDILSKIDAPGAERKLDDIFIGDLVGGGGDDAPPENDDDESFDLADLEDILGGNTGEEEELDLDFLAGETPEESNEETQETPKEDAEEEASLEESAKEESEEATSEKEAKEPAEEEEAKEEIDLDALVASEGEAEAKEESLEGKEEEPSAQEGEAEEIDLDALAEMEVESAPEEATEEEAVEETETEPEAKVEEPPEAEVEKEAAVEEAPKESADEEEEEGDIGEAIDMLFADSVEEDEEKDFDIDSILSEATAEEESKKKEATTEDANAMQFDDSEEEVDEISELAKQEAREKGEDPDKVEDAEKAEEESPQEADESDDGGEEEASEGEPSDEESEVVDEEGDGEEEDVSQEDSAEEEASDEEVAEEGEADEEAAEEEVWDGEFEDDEEDEVSSKEGDRAKLLTLLGKAAAFLVTTLLVMYLSSQVVKVFVESKNAEEEMIAARGIADMAMVLAHVQLTTPEQLAEGRDPSELVKQNLHKVLTEEYRKLSPLENYFAGEEAVYDFKYITSGDGKRFLLFVLPRQGFFQSWVPKQAMLIDSQVWDVRSGISPADWGNLIGKSLFLDSSISDFDIQTLRNEVDPLRLSFLNAGDSSQGFAIPNLLEDWIDEAEYKIYFSPRYFQLGKKMNQLAQKLNKPGASEEDVAALREEVSKLTQFEDFVFYSPDGRKAARHSYKTLKVYVPEASLYLGYLEMDPLSKKIGQVDLLTERDFPENYDLPPLASAEDKEWGMQLEEVEKSHVAKEEEKKMMPAPLPKRSSSEDRMMDERKEMVMAEESMERREAFPENQFYELLQQGLYERKRALDEISMEMSELLKNEALQPQKGFDEQFAILSEAYKGVGNDHFRKLKMKMEALYNEEVLPNPDQNLEPFQEAIDRLGLSSYLSMDMKSDIREVEIESFDDDQLEELFLLIDRSIELDELDRLVQKASDVFAKDLVGSSLKRVAYQNRLRSLVLIKIGNFILTPTVSREKALMQNGNRMIVDRILRNANVSDEDERTYFLEEFDNLMEQYRAAPDKQELSRLKNVNEKLAIYATYDDLLSSSEKSALKKKHQRAIKVVDKEEQSLQDLKNKIISVPLAGLQNSGKDAQLREYGRLGQQLLIFSSMKPPGKERDGRLIEAIQLLHEGVVENRKLWEDILEARRLLAETPEMELYEVLNSGLGFLPKDRPLPLKIKNELKLYFEEKKKLALIRDKHLYEAQYGMFKGMEERRLRAILESVERLQRESRKLKLSVGEYVERLREFTGDYEEAKQQGFFLSGLQHQSMMANRLTRKIRHSERLFDRVENVSNQLLAASEKHAGLARSELESLENGTTMFTIDEVAAASQMTHEVAYPNLVAEDIQGRAKKIFNIVVAPVP